MIKKIILFPVLVLSLIISSASFANIKKYDDCLCKDKMAMMKKWEKRLNLTDEQKKQIKAIKEQSRSQKQAIFEKMKELKKEMHALVTSDQMDQGKLNGLINQKKELIGEKLKLKLETKNKIYNLLDDKQKKQFSSMMKAWGQKKMDQMKKMMDDQNNELE